MLARGSTVRSAAASQGSVRDLQGMQDELAPMLALLLGVVHVHVAVSAGARNSIAQTDKTVNQAQATPYMMDDCCV